MKKKGERVGLKDLENEQITKIQAGFEKGEGAKSIDQAIRLHRQRSFCGDIFTLDSNSNGSFVLVGKQKT